MKESKGDVRCGIFLKETNFKLVEVEASPAQQFKINKIIQADIEQALNVNSIQNDHLIAEIGSQIREILKVFNISINKAVYTLGSPFALVKKLPIDANISDDEVIDQIDWEVKQFSYSPDDEYIVDFQRFKAAGELKHQEIVVVSVREKVIQQLKKMFAAGKIPVRVVDLDIFAAFRAVEVNYDLKIGDTVVLIDVDENILKFTILKDKEFYYYTDIDAAKLNRNQNSFSSTDNAHLVRAISLELKRIIMDLKLGDSVEAVQRIFLYGNSVRDTIIQYLQTNFNVRIDKVNPFRKLYIAPKVSVDEKIWSHPETFTVCVGSALRG